MEVSVCGIKIQTDFLRFFKTKKRIKAELFSGHSRAKARLCYTCFNIIKIYCVKKQNNMERLHKLLNSFYSDEMGEKNIYRLKVFTKYIWMFLFMVLIIRFRISRPSEVSPQPRTERSLLIDTRNTWMNS